MYIASVPVQGCNLPFTFLYKLAKCYKTFTVITRYCCPLSYKIYHLVPCDPKSKPGTGWRVWKQRDKKSNGKDFVTITMTNKVPVTCVTESQTGIRQGGVLSELTGSSMKRSVKRSKHNYLRIKLGNVSSSLCVWKLERVCSQTQLFLRCVNPVVCERLIER